MLKIFMTLKILLRKIIDILQRRRASVQNRNTGVKMWILSSSVLWHPLSLSHSHKDIVHHSVTRKNRQISTKVAQKSFH